MGGNNFYTFYTWVERISTHSTPLYKNYIYIYIYIYWFNTFVPPQRRAGLLPVLVWKAKNKFHGIGTKQCCVRGICEF